MGTGNALSVECCGSERTTPFCSECGKRILDIHSIYGLLEHCQGRLNILESELHSSKRANPELEDGSRAAIKRSHKEDIIHKWDCWISELSQLLQAKRSTCLESVKK